MWYMCIPFLAIAQVLSTCDGHSCPGLKTEPIERGGGDKKCSNEALLNYRVVLCVRRSSVHVHICEYE